MTAAVVSFVLGVVAFVSGIFLLVGGINTAQSEPQREELRQLVARDINGGLVAGAIFLFVGLGVTFVGGRS